MDVDDKTKADTKNVEFAGKHATQGIAGEVVLVSELDEVRRIPIPTGNPNDPLNLDKWRKLGVVVTCCWFSIFSLMSVSGVGTFMATLFKMYLPEGHSPNAIVGLSTYPSLVMAFGCLGLLPLAFVFGRRPIFLLAVLICLISNIVAGLSKDFQSHFIARIFLGLGTGATESLLPLILSDITFLHERSFYFGLYWSVQNCVTSGLQIAISYLVAAETWRWYYWLFTITLSFSTLLGFFLLPETKFHRPPTLLNGHLIVTDDFGATRTIIDPEEIAQFEDLDGYTSTEEKRTFMQELKPWSDVTPNGVQVLLGAYMKILKSLSSPGVIFSLLAASISLGIGIGITLIYSSVLEQQYHWSARSVGLFNAGVMPACLLAMLYSGWCADKLNIWLARRNGGVHKPEHHLIHLIVPCIASIIGLVAIAVCAQYPEKYSAWGLVIGWAIYQFGFTSIIITTTTFAAEVIPDNPGAGVVVVVGGKNIISFSAAQGLVPMVTKYSYITTFMILMGISIAIFLMGIPVYFLNTKWRKVTGPKSKVVGSVH